MRTSESDIHPLLPSFDAILRHLLVAMIATTSACTADPEPEPGWASILTPRSSTASDVAMMSVGDGTTCLTMYDGKTKCWGHNDAGQLGLGDDTTVGDDESPAAMAFIDLGGHARQLHTNGRQNFALLDTGVVRAWGANETFELGLEHREPIGDDESPASASVTVDVKLGGPAVELVVGADFACARLEDGTVRCWGANDTGQLGYGHTHPIGDDESPAEAGGVALGAAAIGLVAGAHHACAQLEGGDLRCWGANDMGQLGYGHTNPIGDDERPAEVDPLALDGGVVELVAGEAHTCARFEDGSVQCWGANDTGQLGYGHTEAIGDDELPATAGEVLEGEAATGLVAGAQHTCALLLGGRLRCWGDGLDGRLGYGDESERGDDEPALAIDDVDLGGQRVSAVFSGPTASSTCVRLEEGAVRCWGLNDMGQLGLGHTDPVGDTAETTPARIPDIIVVDDADG